MYLAYRIEVGPKARTRLDDLDAAIGSAVERKIIGLAKTPLRWFIGGLSACRTMWQVCANYE